VAALALGRHKTTFGAAAGEEVASAGGAAHGGDGVSWGHAMAAPDLARFRASMNITYEQWHDGIGYDLDALGRLDPDERAEAEAWLVPRRTSDWRDVEALDCLGTPRALAALVDALDARDVTVRIHAAERLLRRRALAADKAEAIALAALGEASIANGMTRALAFAEAHATEAVRRKLLACARDGNDDIRVHAAALAHFLHGGAASSFDWSKRPLYLRFGSNDPAERQAAFLDLCASIQVDPTSIAS
jgi:hypothetical protein